MGKFQDELNNKANLSDLQAMEQSITDKIGDIIKSLSKNFADKNETKKALKLLERQLKNLYDLFMSKGGNEHDEDAMFSKKPLGGLSCASCEKDLINMYGKRVEFMPWSKLPFRDPAERIARVGQGFSKMLSMINPDQLSRFDQHGSRMPGEQSSEPFYRDQNEANVAGKTHTRFPNPNKFGSDSKRPGSAS